MRPPEEAMVCVYACMDVCICRSYLCVYLEHMPKSLTDMRPSEEICGCVFIYTLNVCQSMSEQLGALWKSF